MKLKVSMLVAVAVLVLAVVGRVLPHTSNMTPFFAIALGLGVWFGKGHRLLAGGLVILAMLVSDAFLGFHATVPFVYAAMLLAVLLGSYAEGWLQRSKTLGVRFGTGLTASIFGSFLFFVVTNIGVWLVGGLYPLTGAGLFDCFAMAVPFFRQSLVTDMLFGTAFMLVADFVQVRRSLSQPLTDGRLHG